MRWESVCLESIGYVLPDERVASAQLEERIAPIYKAMNLGMGQLVAMTGIEERRFWPPNPRMAVGASQAGQEALDLAGVAAEDVGVVIYAGAAVTTSSRQRPVRSLIDLGFVAMR